MTAQNWKVSKLSIYDIHSKMFSLSSFIHYLQGHTLGHTITGAFSGGSGGHDSQPAQQITQPELNTQNPCEYEMRQFLECANNQSDITLCQGFNEALKQCKMYYNTPGGKMDNIYSVFGFSRR